MKEIYCTDAPLFLVLQFSKLLCLIFKDVIQKYRDKIISMEEDIEEVMRLEEEEKEMRITELQMHKANAMLEHQKEIFSRPKRTWFQTHKERKIEQGKSGQKPCYVPLSYHHHVCHIPVYISNHEGRMLIQWKGTSLSPLPACGFIDSSLKLKPTVRMGPMGLRGYCGFILEYSFQKDKKHPDDIYSTHSQYPNLPKYLHTEIPLYQPTHVMYLMPIL